VAGYCEQGKQPSGFINYREYIGQFSNCQLLKCTVPREVNRYVTFHDRGSNPVLIKSPPELADMTLEKRLVTYDWENHFKSFQEATRKGSFKPLCWIKKPTLLQVSSFSCDSEIRFVYLTQLGFCNNVKNCRAYLQENKGFSIIHCLFQKRSHRTR